MAEKEKSLYQQVIDGDIEPEGCQKGWINLREGQTTHNLRNIDPEKAREIRRKGAETINKLHGEKKSAKQSIERILTLKVDDDIIAGADLDPKIAERLKRDNPDATLYDLIQLVAVGRAVGGNIKAAEYVRDTHGDAPKQQVELTGQIMTDSDRELLQAVGKRLDNAELTVVVDQQGDNTQA